MARRTAEVTWKKAKSDRIPEDLGEGVALVVDLDRRGVLEWFAAHIRIRREGGYCGFDVALFLVLYFATSPAVGIRKFWDRVRLCSRKLAATARRTQLPSPASVSRALAAVEPELFQPEVESLLSEGADIDKVLRHPAVQTYDGCGDGWHVFDFDPTVTTLRHRALPEGEGLPAARRRSVPAAAPGYPGRKRGEVQFSRGTLQHAGSSAWLHAMLGTGNGDGHAELEAALGVVVRTCNRLRHPLDRALLRIDGGFGWVPYFAACRAHGIPFLTRLTRPQMFEQPEVLSALRNGIWHMVPDSLSGPQRSALDLGIVTVPPGHATRREDGTPYDPVAVRIVVSRYPRSEKTGHGRLIDGWQYEMFAVDVPADALPAPEAVAMYFGRAGQENRFAQEDREVGLDRIFSYHLPGQEFAVVVGLFTWNLRLVHGFELAPPPAVRPVQEAYVSRLDPRCAPPVAPPPADRTSGVAQPSEAPPADDAPSAAAAPSASESAPVAPLPEPDRTSLLEELRRIDWDHSLRTHPGWSFDSAAGRLRCKDGRELVLTTVRKGEHAKGRTHIIFCRPAGGCDPCAERSGCLHSRSRRTSKHIEFSVPTSTADHLRELLRTHRRACTEARSRQAAATAQSPTKRARRSFPIAPLAPVIALLSVVTSLFLPALARQILRTAASGLTITVAVTDLPPWTPRPVLIAESVGDRQHRRKTWRQNFQRYALDPEAHVRIKITGGEGIRRLLGPPDGRAMT